MRLQFVFSILFSAMAGASELGSWAPAVAAAIESLAQSKKGQAPVAVLPFDNSVVEGDLAELAFSRLVDRAEFKFSDDFWKIVPIAFGRQALRASYESFAGTPSNIWDSQPGYMKYRRLFLSSYQDICSKVGRKECRVYLAKLWLGFSNEDITAYAGKIWAEESARGLKVSPQWAEMISFLKSRGFAVWVASPDAQPLLEGAVGHAGLEARRALGVHLKTAEVPIRMGKVSELAAATGVSPALVIGASRDDIDLLSYQGGLRILADSGDPALRVLALKAGWLVQPSILPSR
jgi:hypothetical protein